MAVNFYHGHQSITRNSVVVIQDGGRRSRNKNARNLESKAHISEKNKSAGDSDILLRKLKRSRESLSTELKPDFDKAVLKVVDDYISRALKTEDFPGKPEREYQPRESIIDYIRAKDGFGPWLEAGTLSRPFIRSQSMSAYTALANWLRYNELPDDIHIPTKSELIDRELKALSETDVARGNRLAAVVGMRKVRERRTPEI